MTPKPCENWDSPITESAVPKHTPRPLPGCASPRRLCREMRKLNLSYTIWQTALGQFVKSCVYLCCFGSDFALLLFPFRDLGGVMRLGTQISGNKSADFRRLSSPAFALWGGKMFLLKDRRSIQSSVQNPYKAQAKPEYSTDPVFYLPFTKVTGMPKASKISSWARLRFRS